MKNSYDFDDPIEQKYKTIINHDRIEIDNPNKRNYVRLNYIDRINTIIALTKKYFPKPNEIKIGDFACAQGNITLLLAEMGYKLYAIDINQTFIEYSKMKYEKGDIEWINSNIEDLKFSENSLDLAIAGELIEHCAFPEEILKNISNFIRPKGLMIITTPNASRIFTGLPTFKQYMNKEQRIRFKEKQFGPDDQDHLFLFGLNEIQNILPKNVEIIESGYLGGNYLINKYTQIFLRFLPIQLIEKVIRIFSKIPIINEKFYNHIYLVLKKTRKT